MPTTFKTREGDTFESISRRAYGTEDEAGNIAKANPGVSEPLTGGIVLTTPNIPGSPQDAQQKSLADNEDEVSLLIDNERFRFWDSMQITRSIDSFDIVDFSAPFEPDVLEFRNTFRPFTFKNASISVGGDPLFKGTLINITPPLEANKSSVSVSGYSLPGVLNDCTSPAGSFPLEFNEQGLKSIADAIARPFGLSTVFSDTQGSIFDRVANAPGKKVLSFLTDLAKQRKLIISSTPLGDLLFWREIDTGSPVARLRQGESPLMSVIPIFSPQDYYSHITGLEPVIVGLGGSQYTVKNKHLNGVVRPFTFDTPDTLDADVKDVVGAKIGRMFGSMASYEISVNTWRTPDGDLWTPNTTLTVLAPRAMIYSEYEFLIRSVTFNKNATSKTANLQLTLPGAFKGKVPESLPWDE